MKKRFAAAILCALLLMPTATAFAEVLRGDADGDGKVDVGDIMKLKSAIMTEEYTDELMASADLDQSSTLDVGDILSLKNIIMTGGGETPDDPVIPPPAWPENPVEGWNTVGETKYYYKDGAYLTGHHTIGTFKYYFDDLGRLASHVGVDVSSFQEEIDWVKVAAEGAEFAILRVGGRYWGTTGGIYSDDYFDRNADAAYAAGLKVGCYFYSQAITVEEAIAEADFVLSKIEGKIMEYPIVFDVEQAPDSTARANNISKALRTEIALAFCRRIEEAGYYPMIYANPDWCKNGLDMSRVTEYDLWLAHYSDTPDTVNHYKMWQYSERGKVNGIKYSNVDMNVSYVDYAALIRSLGKNHLS